MEQIQFIYLQYYMQYYTVHHKENSTYVEILASWMMVQAPPTTASLFWFYYSNPHTSYFLSILKKILQRLLSIM